MNALGSKATPSSTAKLFHLFALSRNTFVQEPGPLSLGGVSYCRPSGYLHSTRTFFVLLVSTALPIAVGGALAGHRTRSATGDCPATAISAAGCHT